MSTIDISHDMYIIRESIVQACAFLSAPSVYMKPRVFKDGDKWCCLYGENIQEGVVGFGNSPAEACQEFNSEWWKP